MDRRARFRQGLSALYLPYYDALCGVLGPEWQPYQGLRTVAEQNALFKQGREVPGPNATKQNPLGSRVTDAKGGESAHNYGCATDWTKWTPAGRPRWYLTDEEWREYQMALEKVGLKWGGDWDMDGQTRKQGDRDENRIDYPHNELPIACSWRHIAVTLGRAGMRAAHEHVERNLLK